MKTYFRKKDVILSTCDTVVVEDAEGPVSVLPGYLPPPAGGGYFPPGDQHDHLQRDNQDAGRLVTHSGQPAVMEGELLFPHLHRHF